MQVILDSRVLWHQYYSISILAINICCVNKNVMSISFEEVKEKSNKKLYFKVPKRLFCLYNFVNQIMQDNFFFKDRKVPKDYSLCSPTTLSLPTKTVTSSSPSPTMKTTVYTEIQNSCIDLVLPVPSIVKIPFNIVDGPQSFAAAISKSRFDHEPRFKMIKPIQNHNVSSLYSM